MRFDLLLVRFDLLLVRFDLSFGKFSLTFLVSYYRLGRNLSNVFLELNKMNNGESGSDLER